MEQPFNKHENIRSNIDELEKVCGLVFTKDLFGEDEEHLQETILAAPSLVELIGAHLNINIHAGSRISLGDIGRLFDELRLEVDQAESASSPSTIGSAEEVMSRRVLNAISEMKIIHQKLEH
jgi:hypothetical protein